MKTKSIAMIGLLAALISGAAFQASGQEASPSPTPSPTKASSNKKKPSPTPTPASPSPTKAPSPAAVSPTPAAASPSATKSLRDKYMDAHRKLTPQTPTPATTKSSREKYMDAHRPRFPQLRVSKIENGFNITVEANNMVPNHTYTIGVWGGKRTEPVTLQDYRNWKLTTDSAGHGVNKYISAGCICYPDEGCAYGADFGQPNRISIGLFEPGEGYDQVGVGPLVQTTTPICD